MLHAAISPHWRCSVKKDVLKISQISHENSWVESLFNQPAAWIKRLQHRRFPVKCAKFVRKPILKFICEWLLLYVNHQRTCSAGFRSSRSQMFRKGVCKNSTKLTGKLLCWNLILINLQASVCSFVKKRIQHSCFPVNF